jgi:hypothetical protein
MEGRWTLCGMGEGGLWEDKKGLWIIPLDLKHYDSKFDVTRKVLLGKKCVWHWKDWIDAWKVFSNRFHHKLPIPQFDNQNCVKIIISWIWISYTQMSCDVHLKHV